MATIRSECLVCGKPLVYHETTIPVTCTICGAEGTALAACEEGHYVCDKCHRRKGVEYVIEECKKLDGKNPIEIETHLMDNESINANGPEHHTLIGAALMTAYHNAGGDIDLPAALEELMDRSMQVPGGTCGYWGTCGGATSAGQFYSIISGSNPLNAEPWAKTARLTSNVIGRLADYGGPRCCKRASFVAAQVTVPYVAETMGVQMELPDKVICKYFPRNAQCARERCPYFPEGAIHPLDKKTAKR